MMNKFILVLLAFFVVTTQATATSSIQWASKDNQGNSKVHLYFFWSKDCPHCHEALGYLKQVKKQHKWAKIHLKEITASQKNLKEYNTMAEALGEPADVVPAFFFCGMMYAGYNGQSTGDWIFETMKTCDGKQASLQ